MEDQSREAGDPPQHRAAGEMCSGFKLDVLEPSRLTLQPLSIGYPTWHSNNKHIRKPFFNVRSRSQRRYCPFKEHQGRGVQRRHCLRRHHRHGGMEVKVLDVTWRQKRVIDKLAGKLKFSGDDDGNSKKAQRVGSGNWTSTSTGR